MKKRIFSILVLIILLGGIFTTVSAQNYQITVPKTQAILAINEDGTATVEYYITITVDSGADPQDFLDIGLPNGSFQLRNVIADVDGKEIKNIETSPYVTYGVALGLGDNAIQPGQTSTIHLVAYSIEDMLFPATSEESEPYVSFQFMPNYFDSSAVSGKTDLTVTFYFPPNLKEEEPRYFQPQGWPGADEPITGKETNGLIYYEWNSPNADSESEYTFGASFPARLIPETAIVTEPTPASGTGGSGTTGSGSGFFSSICGSLGCIAGIGGFIALFVWGIIASNKAVQKAKMAYLPPKIAIEGHGIKRGLTAVEAAILMETPMEKVMTMILFSSIKKNAATVTKREPLEIELTSPLPAELQDYEKEFLQAFVIKDPATKKKALQEMMVNLVKSVTQKMKGFSLKETKEYYQDIMRRAWEQVETADTPDVKMQRFDDFMGWTMLDKDFDDRTTRTFGTGPVIVPMWWGRYDPVYRTSTVGGGHVAAPVSSVGGSTSGSGKSVSMPTLPGSAFAGSIVGGIQGFATGVVGDIQGFTSGITRITNPPPPPSTYRSGGGGGHSGGGCACACACAGCACACAGGGR
ncbi:MAG: hypothetical protein ABFD58_03640 [Anaerolineaceae bacterium]